MLNALRLMQALGMTVEEVDACTGPAIGWPKSATFRTADHRGPRCAGPRGSQYLREHAASDESREMYRVPPLVEEMMKRGWLGDKTGQRILQASERRRRRIGNSDARLAEDGISPAAESEIRFDRSGQRQSKTRASDCARWSGRRWRAKAATRRINFCGLRLARRACTRRGGFRKFPTALWTWTARCAGDLRGSWGRLRYGTRSAWSEWRRRWSAKGSRCRRWCGKCWRRRRNRSTKTEKGRHELFRFGERRAETGGRACGNHHSEIAEGPHGGGAGQIPARA